MNTIPQITSAEPRIRMPAWRSASPKKWNTRPLKMSPKAWPQKRMMSPREAIQSVGPPASPCPVAEPVAGREAAAAAAGAAGVCRPGRRPTAIHLIG